MLQIIFHNVEKKIKAYFSCNKNIIIIVLQERKYQLMFEKR